MNGLNIFDETTPRKIKCVKKYDTCMYNASDYNLLEIGKEYTMVDINVGNWSTYVTLEELPGEEFNSVYFCEVEK